MATDHTNTMDSGLWSPRRTRKRDDSGDNRQINDEPKHEPEIPSREEPAGSLALESRNSSRSRFVRGRSANENDGNDRISDIFNAIVKEIHSVISEHQTLQLKTLADVLEDNESLVASQYTIPRAMINDQAIDFLQVLIDRKKRLEPKTKSSPKVEYERFVADRIVGNFSVLNQEPKFSTEIKERPICRICRQKRGFLVRPCACRGPQANVHIECLQRRLDETGENSCELCNHVYKAIHPPRIDLIPSMKFWYKFVATTSERKSINSDVASFISTLTIMVLWNLYVHTYCTEPRNDDNDQDVSSVIFNIGVKIVSVLGSTWFAIRVVTKTNCHLKKWFSWYTQKKSVLALGDYME